MAFSGISFMKFYNHILKFGMCVESAIRKQAVKTKIQLIQILQFPTDVGEWGHLWRLVYRIAVRVWSVVTTFQGPPLLT